MQMFVPFMFGSLLVNLRWTRRRRNRDAVLARLERLLLVDRLNAE